MRLLTWPKGRKVGYLTRSDIGNCGELKWVLDIDGNSQITILLPCLVKFLRVCNLQHGCVW